MSWKDYFVFTRKERIGVVSISVVIILINLSPFVFPDNSTPISIKNLDEGAREWLASIDSSKTPGSRESKSEDASGIRQPFVFDPNMLKAEEWISLGLREKTVQTIMNFKSKGGKFRKPEDLQRIYGIRKEEYRRLAPYVRIRGEMEKGRSGEEGETQPHDRDPNYPPFKRAAQKVDINLADTSAFVALPGIGSKLANRLVTFRSRLGGFHSIEQVAEVYGIKDSLFQQLRRFLERGHAEVKKLNINKADQQELQQHPYIGRQLAPLIVRYRDQHGQFLSIDDIQKIGAIKDSTFRKLKPYLEVE